MFDIAWKVWKFRRRLARAARQTSETPSADRASPAELDRLVAAQTAHWERQMPWSPDAAAEVLHALNERSSSAFIMSVRGCSVRVWKKRAFSFSAHEAEVRRDQQRSYRVRALCYRAYLELVLRRGALGDCAFDFALDVNDLPEEVPGLPVFGFQKKRNAHNLLLPDVDFFNGKWYRNEHDALAYEDKQPSACFVGSSTGGWLTEEMVRDHATPRLHAAAYFHGHPQVVFQIANATQCLTEEARACLTRQPYFGAHASWEAQLKHRFMIVIDGNGATCSRLVKGLMSHSVVVKFDSEHELYYFRAMQPGQDHLLVRQEADVERIVEHEAASPGTYKGVAEAGNRFAAKYLTMPSVMDYTARLLRAFDALNRRRPAD